MRFYFQDKTAVPGDIAQFPAKASVPFALTSTPTFFLFSHRRKYLTAK